MRRRPITQYTETQKAVMWERSNRFYIRHGFVKESETEFDVVYLRLPRQVAPGQQRPFRAKSGEGGIPVATGPPSP